MAYKIVFIKQNGKTQVLVKEKSVSGIGVLATEEKDEGYGYIKIANHVIEESCNERWRMLKCVKKSQYVVDNKVYMVNPSGYVGYYPGREVKPHKCSLYCTDIMDSKYRAYQLISSDTNIFNMVGEVKTYLVNRQGQKFEYGRHFSKSNYKGLVAETPMIFNINNIIEKYGIACNSESTIDNLKEIIKDLNVHHVNAHWDMRKESAVILSKQEHKKLHNKIGQGSHRIDVVINTAEELNAFLDFVESDEYFKLFKK